MTARGVQETSYVEPHVVRARRGAITASSVQKAPRLARSNRWIVSPTNGNSSKTLQDPAVQNAMKICGI
jgi:hypothetical protein